MTPEQRRLREAHLARRALVRMLGPALGDKRSPRRRSTRFTPSLGRLYVTALCAPFRGARIDHRWATGEWVVTVLLSRDRHAITFETPTLTNITDQVRAAILATHGPEALP